MNNYEDIIDFTIYYNKYKTKIYNYTLRMVNDRDTAEDILQEVFIKFFENFNLIQNKNSIIFWLFKTTQNLVYTYYNYKNKFKNHINLSDNDDEINEIPADIDIINGLEEKELSILINQSIELLPLEQKEVYLLKEYGNLSYKEIGELLKIDSELVKSRIFKARQKLIKIISKKIK
ncbi:MAG TPA: RNA polymerase sigma factor [Melioribacteraceae bacterium]|nr:RNA polymerase sigma factor [Melioribacteraceae bacterium]